MTEYHQTDQTISYNLLYQLKVVSKEKQEGKLQKDVLFLQKNAPAHRADKLVDILKSESIDFDNGGNFQMIHE